MWWDTVTHWRGSEGETGEWGEQLVPFTLPQNMVYPALLPTIKADAHTLAASRRMNWSPRRFKWTRPFHQKTKSGFCECAVTFQLSTINSVQNLLSFSAAIWCFFSCNDPPTLTTAHINCIWSCRMYNWSKSFGDGTFSTLATNVTPGVQHPAS